ncbi:MAG: membrane protein insertion efficiency factor YidD [Clostridiaceae bacterium]|nr:membrane protein insertion efficiency factor YidD [Clostridiaceae bacterium]
MSKLAIKLIRYYQTNISAYTPPTCKYYPTCSEYAIGAIQNWGFLRGTLLAIWRILRCNPFSKGGYDPVPQPKKKF